MLFPFRARTLVASLDGDAGGGPTHPLVYLTLWLQKLTKEEKVNYLCDREGVDTWEKIPNIPVFFFDGSS